MHWADGKGVIYMNSGKEIGYEEAVDRIKSGEYAVIDFSWRGVIPADVFIEAQRIKSELEKIIRGIAIK